MNFKLESQLIQALRRAALPGCICAVALAGTVDPFQGVPLPFGVLPIFWLLVMALAALSICTAEALLPLRFRDRHRGFREASLALCILSIFSPALWMLFWVVSRAFGGAAPSFPEMARYGVILASGMILLKRAFPLREDQSAETRPRLERRLPNEFSGDVLRLTVEDHSVCVVTTEGNHVIRMRFTDAIDEMEPMRGYCTHRSHWVAETAIESVERQSGRISLRLINGDVVPVSRKYRPALEEAGIV
ncbi:LytTR family DNA-binding domain-containing protein [Cribrihabitans sp. XS_ASV171]